MSSYHRFGERASRGAIAALCALSMLAPAPVAHAHAPKDAGFENIDISEAVCCRDFSLTDHRGAARSIKDFRGKIVILTFGFTHCPDVCPTTLAAMSNVRRKLGRDAQKVQVLFVTLDPERDTAEVLAKYVPAFDPTFVGLRGSTESIAKTAREFRVFYKKQAGTQEGSYLVDHTLGSYVFDRDGKARLFVSHGKDQQLISDIRSLLSSKRAVGRHKTGA